MSGYYGHAASIDIMSNLYLPRLPAAAPSARNYTRSRDGRLPRGFIPANINRHTGKPHQHKREIARRQRQAGAK